MPAYEDVSPQSGQRRSNFESGIYAWMSRFCDPSGKKNNMKNKESTNIIREYRETRGMKQVELAARAAVPVALLNRTERWHLPVSLPTAQRIADALGVGVGEVFPYMAGKEAGR
jgi:ribosome-binding protein aMBF1 (putative translation factor)